MLLFPLHFRAVLPFRHGTFSTTLSPHCLQRPSGLAQRRLTLPFMRATNVQFRTAFSAGLLPPLRQTACWRLAFLRKCCLFHFHYIVGLNFVFEVVLNSTTLSAFISLLVQYSIPLLCRLALRCQYGT